MKIETTLDKVVLTEQEVQKILQPYIENTLSRDVEGRINFQQKNGSCMAAWCHLKPESK